MGVELQLGMVEKSFCRRLQRAQSGAIKSIQLHRSVIARFKVFHMELILQLNIARALSFEDESFCWMTPLSMTNDSCSWAASIHLMVSVFFAQIAFIGLIMNSEALSCARGGRIRFPNPV